MDNFHVKDYAKHFEVGISHIMAYTTQVNQARLGWYSTAVLTFKENPSIEIIGIMKRSREKKIAFMADTEAMYHQVFIPDDQHTFLKFLWWTTDNINDEPQDFMMCAHVLGGTSSASCSNCALRRIAIDNKEVYGTNAATTLLRNFYMVDLLKPMKDVQSANQLVQNVINMCKSGGFNLTKFMSKNEELLATIPEENRKEAVKDKDLSGDLPNNKV